MARTSTPWRLLPAQELGYGSPATVWRRLNQWATAGVFEQLHLEILDRLGRSGRLDWSRASVASMRVRAKHGGPRWRKPGRSRQARVQAPPGLRGARAAANRRGHRRQRPRRGDARRGRRRHPAGAHAVGPTAGPAGQAGRRQRLRQRGQPRLAAPAWDHRADRPAWDPVVDPAGAASLAVEGALSWLRCFRRLQVRWDRGSERWFALVLLACALTCFKRR
jgi:hypothetical protein